MKMNKKVLSVILLFLGILGILFISAYLYITDSHNKDQKLNISVIVYGNNGERWATLKNGIEQGAADYGAGVNFITMTTEDNANEQKKLLKREIDNGADGIILAVTDSVAMANIVEDISSKLPIVMVETNVDNVNGVNYISADNYSMGLNLGRSVILNNDGKSKVAVIMENHQRSSVQERFDGFMDSLKYSDYVIDLWERDESDENYKDDEDLLKFIQHKWNSNGADIIVALDDASLEAVVDASQTYNIMADVYGVGSTRKIIHYLDYGVIQSIVFQNEFNMGFLSVQALFRTNEDQEERLMTEIEFRTINRETMYLPKNQRLVFPIIQ